MTKQKAIEILSNLITNYVDSIDINKKEIRKLDKALETLIKSTSERAERIICKEYINI